MGQTLPQLWRNSDGQNRQGIHSRGARQTITEASLTEGVIPVIERLKSGLWGQGEIVGMRSSGKGSLRSELRAELWEAASHAVGGRHSTQWEQLVQAPQVGLGLVNLRNIKETSVAGVSRGRKSDGG